MRHLVLAVALLAGCGAPFEPDVFGGAGGAGPATSASVGTSASSASTGGSGGEGGAPGCDAAKDCGPVPNVECGSWACAEHACVMVPADAGKLTAGNVPGDCKILVCDGTGGAEYLPADDPKSDGNPCTVDACDGFTQPPSANAAPDEPCPTGVCDGNGSCVECLHGYQCASGSCLDEVCQ